MRDPRRIGEFCDELKAIWSCVPDWRFGQLMCNMLRAYVSEKGRDYFFAEDAEMIEFFRSYINTSGSTPWGTRK